MEDKRQTERVISSEVPSKKDDQKIIELSPECIELTKAFEKSMGELEDMVKLLKSDINKLLLFDISELLSEARK